MSQLVSPVRSDLALTAHGFCVCTRARRGGRRHKDWKSSFGGDRMHAIAIDTKGTP